MSDNCTFVLFLVLMFSFIYFVDRERSDGIKIPTFNEQKKETLKKEPEKKDSKTEQKPSASALIQVNDLGDPETETDFFGASDTEADVEWANVELGIPDRLPEFEKKAQEDNDEEMLKLIQKWKEDRKKRGEQK